MELSNLTKLTNVFESGHLSLIKCDCIATFCLYGNFLISQNLKFKKYENMHANIGQLSCALIIIISLLYVNRSRGCKWENNQMIHVNISRK